MGALEPTAATTQQAHSAHTQTHTCTCPCSCLVFIYHHFYSAQLLFVSRHAPGSQFSSAASTRDETHRRARVSVPKPRLPAHPARQRAFKRHRALAGRAVPLCLPCPRLWQQAPDQTVSCFQTPPSHRAGERNRPLRVCLLILLHPSTFSSCTRGFPSSIPSDTYSLTLSSMGWDVVATDLPAVIDTVLARNVANNNSALPSDSGTIQVRALDWAVPAEQWLWDNDKIIASTDDIPAASPSSDDTTLLRPPFDLIVTADTVYSTELVHPLLQTLQALCKQSAVTSPKGTREPPVHLCLERRDPVLVDYVLAEAAKSWTVKRVPHGKLTRAIEKGGHLWEQSQWEDVEIWTFTQKNS